MLYRSVPNNLLQIMNNRRERQQYVVNPALIENPNQLRVVPSPEPIPPITDSTCGVCLDTIVGEGCRVDCPAGHIFHCECINEWRNTRISRDVILEDRFHNDCPLCRASISSMYHVDIPEGFTTNFGKRTKRNGDNTRNNLKSVNSLIKYLESI
jgi:hypothetical protein